MTVKLLCHGSQPLGRRPVVVERWGFKKCSPGEIVEARDQTEAELLMEQYPKCFSICIEELPPETQPDPASAEFTAPEKPAKKTFGGKRDKMKSEESIKDFF